MQKLNHLIDHTNLNPQASYKDIARLVAEAQTYQFHSVCIRSKWIKDFAQQYRCSSTIGFPEVYFTINSPEDLAIIKKQIGAVSLESKIQEAKLALEQGAMELDPVIDLSDFNHIKEELKQYFELLIDYCRTKQDANSYWLKPIFSCELLSEVEIQTSIEILCSIYNEYASKFKELNIQLAYKNSTGFVKISNDLSTNLNFYYTKPILFEIINQSLNQNDPDKNIFIKAAGGLKTYFDALYIIDAAKGRLSHIGSSQSIRLIDQNLPA